MKSMLHSNHATTASLDLLMRFAYKDLPQRPTCYMQHAQAFKEILEFALNRHQPELMHGWKGARSVRARGEERQLHHTWGAKEHMMMKPACTSALCQFESTRRFPGLNAFTQAPRARMWQCRICNAASLTIAEVICSRLCSAER